MKTPPVAWGVHLIDRLREQKHSVSMKITASTPGPSQQTLLAALVCLPQLLLTEKSSVDENFISLDEPNELTAEDVGYNHHGLNE